MRCLSIALTVGCVVFAMGVCHAQEKVTIPDDIRKDMEHYVGTWVGEYTMADKACVMVGREKNTNTVVSRSNVIGGWCPIAGKYTEWVFDTNGNYSQTHWSVGEDGQRTGELSGIFSGQRVTWVNERKVVDHDTMTGVIKDKADKKTLADVPYTIHRKAGPEITLREAQKAWKFLEGDWAFTSPDGEVQDIRILPLQLGVGYIWQGPSATHVWGWNPRSKELASESYFTDGTKALATFERKPDGKIVGTVAVTESNGNTNEFEGVFSEIASDKWHYSIGEQVWTAKRK